MKDMTDRSQRVAELLDHLQKGDERRFKDFCKALEKNGQDHIVKDYLKSGCQAGGDAMDAVPRDADDMPLSRENSCKLTACWNDLIDKIDGGRELLGYLESLKVFSDLQLKKLKASNLHLHCMSLNLVYWCFLVTRLFDVLACVLCEVFLYLWLYFITSFNIAIFIMLTLLYKH